MYRYHNHTLYHTSKLSKPARPDIQGQQAHSHQKNHAGPTTFLSIDPANCHGVVAQGKSNVQ